LNRKDTQFRCHFSDSGFTLEGRDYSPCHVGYHPACFCIGIPFTTRLDDDKGLKCSTLAAIWKGFICESCRVRAAVRRELQRTAQDVALLMIKRATIVDTFNHWSDGTLKAYRSKFNVIKDFEDDFRIPTLPHPHLAHPPVGDARPLMWAQERYSCYPAQWKRTAQVPRSTIKWGTIRGLRSAAALQSTFNLLQSCPSRVTYGFRDKPTVVTACNHPTDELGYTVFSDGMKRRIGDKSFPSAVLLDQHVQWMDTHFRKVVATTTDSDVRLDSCRAAIVNLIAWLAWLRALETFMLKWRGVHVVPPAAGPSEGLPLGLGVVKCDLQDQTKSSQTHMVDVCIAYATLSGKSLGWWIELYRSLLPTPSLAPSAYLISHADGTPWTSHFFRYTYVYPLLALQSSMGDQYLMKFDESPGRGLVENLWSFNMYRLGGRGQVSRKRPSNARKATTAEVVEHGRWRVSRSTLDMPTAYLEWSVADRVPITYFCM
jgi:hypothetical protein